MLIGHFQIQEDTLTERAAAETQLERLGAEFAPAEHKTRSQGGQDLTYVDISATLNRLNAVLGTGWSIDRASTQVKPLDSGAYFAFTELWLDAVIDGKRKVAYGVGAMVNKDPDMAAKTALAEAIKKAGHQLGVALYLWDAERRDSVMRKKEIASMSEAKLKSATFKIAKEALGKERPAVADVATFFGVTPGEMADPAVLRRLLEEREA